MELSRMSSYFVAAFRWLLTDDLTEAQRAQRVLGCNHLERPGVRVCVAVGRGGLMADARMDRLESHTRTQGFYYGRVYADNLFVFTITMTFALVAPVRRAARCSHDRTPQKANTGRS